MRLLIAALLGVAIAASGGELAMAQSDATTKFVERARDIEMFSVRAGATNLSATRGTLG